MVNFHSLIIKELSIKYYRSSKYITVTETLNNFNISNGSLFGWLKLKKKNMLICNKKPYNRKLKITPIIKCFIRSYILKKTYFEYKILLNVYSSSSIAFTISITSDLLTSCIQ